MDDNKVITELTAFLESKNAHASFEDAVDGLTLQDVSTVPANLPYSIWQLAEHIRLTQWDILEFSRNPHHTSPNWPKDFWPRQPAPESIEEWKDCIARVTEQRKEFLKFLRANAATMTVPLAHGDGQTLLREALLIGDHTSYHVGEILVLRRLLGLWK